MTPRALARPVAALLPAAGGRVAVAGSAAGAWASALAEVGWTASATGPVEAALASFLGAAADAETRAAVLTGMRARLEPGGRLVVVDHNRPRGRLAAWLAVPGLWRRGLGAARARHPTAREIAASGFVVERLRLAAGERVQMVVARSREAETALRTR